MSESVRVSEKKPEAAKEDRTSQTRTSDYSQPVNSSIDRILFLQRTAGNQAVGRLIKSGALHAKLTIGQPDDIYEQEADRVADQVMRMLEPTAAAQPEVDEDKPKPDIQTKHISGEITPLVYQQPVIGDAEDNEVASDLTSSLGAGETLDTASRTYFEPRFGHDFGNVRIHHGPQADRAAASVQARAFTLGRNVVFAAEEHDPGSEGGKRLLAHELTHVVQQSSADGIHVRQSNEKHVLSPITAINVSTSPACQPFVACCQVLPVPELPPVPVRPPLRVIEGGRRGPGRGRRRRRALPVPGGPRYAPPDPYDDSIEAGIERGNIRDYAERQRIDAERPIATIDRGGNPPTFITVHGTQNVSFLGGPGGRGVVTARIQHFHILDAIENEVGQATNEEQLEEVLERYVPLVAMRNGIEPSRRSRFLIPPIIFFPMGEPIYLPDFNPRAQARLQVFETAARTRVRAVPALARSRIIPQSRRRGGCRIEPISPLGDDPLSILYCHAVTGSPYSYKITIESETGGLTQRWAEIDSLRGNTWYECKCGYEALLSGAARGLGVAEAVLQRLDHQVLNHIHIARTCGLEYRYIVSNERVAEILRQRWFGNVVIDVRAFESCD